ncbi:MAG: hypothetical protein E7176_00980 [Erysipelotrichaceae bacterium]|nr:hypothetical protein [Erysipelotrichaceae bacterium]
MMLAIFVFLISIVLLSSNIHLYIRSKEDTIKVYIRIGMFYATIPHHKMFRYLIFSKNDSIIDIRDSIMRIKSLTLNIFSHSIINRIYIAKFSKDSLLKHPIENALYLIFANQFTGMLQGYFKYVDINNIKLEYDKSYENIDYYFDGHISVYNLIYSSVKTIIKR